MYITDKELTVIPSFLIVLLILIESNSIEKRYVKQFIGEFLKELIILGVICAFIKIGIIYNNVKNSGYLIDVNLVNYIFFITIVTVALTYIWYIIEKTCSHKINSDYLKYIIFEGEIVLGCIFILDNLKKFALTGILVLILLKLIDYKKRVFNKLVEENIDKGKDEYLGNFIIFILILEFNYYGKQRWIIDVLLTICFIMYIFHYKKLSQKNNKKLLLERGMYFEENYEFDDRAICEKDKLYETRKKELDYLTRYIKKKVKPINEPFAFAISGAWGAGKSSIANVLKKELENDYIIFELQPMISDTREGLITLFYENLENNFLYYGLYTGRDSSIDVYFREIFKLLGQNSNLVFDKIMDLGKNKKLNLRDKKNELQKDIISLNKISNKKILLVVDDFDRVDKDVQYSILTFIKEIINFSGVDSIILMDYEKINENSVDNKTIDHHFLEKFINKRFELSKLDTYEIIDYYKDKLLKLNDNENVDVLAKELYDLCLNIDVYLKEIEDILKNKITLLNNEKYNKLTQEKKELADDKQSSINESILKEIIAKINLETSNPRKIKRIIRELDDKVFYANELYCEFGKLKKQELIKNINIKRTILCMVLVKCIYEKEFDKLLLHKDIKSYLVDARNDDKENKQVRKLILTTIFNINEINISYNIINKIEDKKFDFIMNLFINIETPKDFFDFKEEKDKIREMLEKGDIKIDNKKSVKNNILKLYDKYPDIFVKYMDNISKFMSDKLKAEKIPLEDAIELVQIKGHRGIVLNNEMYIDELKKYLSKNLVFKYENNDKRQKDKYLIDLCKEEIIDSMKHNIAFIISYKNIGRPNSKDYEEISKDIEDYKTLNDINSYLGINEEKDTDKLTFNKEIDKFKEWIEEKIIEEDRYKLKKEELLKQINVLINLDFIQCKITLFGVSDCKYRENYIKIPYSEIAEDIKSMEKDLEEDKTDEQIYNLCSSYIKIINKLLERKDQLIKEDIDILEKIYNKFTIDDKYKMEISDNKLDIIYLKLKEIRAMLCN